MKKTVLCLIFALIIVLSTAFIINAAEITIVSPTEEEIMPGRDFYVVGTIDRGNSNAKSNPLNIKIELVDPSGSVVREIMSNVSPNGLSSAAYFLTDYEAGAAENDEKGAATITYTPPEIVYNGTDRDSIRLAYNKIVVKDDYFSAIIFGGATKEIDLVYTDEHEVSLKDITTGNYKLKIYAFDLNGEEVSFVEKTIRFSDAGERIVANGDFSTYESDEAKVVPSSVVGIWQPDKYIKKYTNDYKYTTTGRYIKNSDREYGASKKVGILLNNLYTNSFDVTTKLGSAFSEESSAEIGYYYYDIGEREVAFNFADATFVREGKIVKANKSKFIKILRAEYAINGTKDTYCDFNMNDGAIYTKNAEIAFYGVYTPVDVKTDASSGKYSIKNKIEKIKTVLSDENGTVLASAMSQASLIKDNANTARFEFSVNVPDFKDITEYKKLYLTVFACDAEGNELIESEPVVLKISSKGSFISGYDDSYWGKIFCDTANIFGSTPSGDALNPDEFITRGDFAAMVNNLMGYAYISAGDFSDLKEDHVFYDDCATACAQGYMTGDHKGMIKAEDLISREQAMIILARISKAGMGEVPVSFIDIDEVSFWAEEQVSVMASNGIVTGFRGYLHPKENITCAEATALIIKTVKWMNKAEDEVSKPPVEDVTTPDNFTDTEFIAEVNFENLKKFYADNARSFDALTTYLRRNCLNGIYVSKVGAGLEMRDYYMGDFVKLSDNALSLVTALSEKFAVFSIRYNPTGDGAVYFVLGKNAENKDIGITYTLLESLKGRSLTALGDNWYYFIKE